MHNTKDRFVVYAYLISAKEFPDACRSYVEACKKKGITPVFERFTKGNLRSKFTLRMRRLRTLLKESGGKGGTGKIKNDKSADKEALPMDT